MQISAISKAIEIKISTVVAISAILHQTNSAQLDAALREMTGGEADFFEDELAVIDLAGIDLSTDAVNWPALVALLKSYRLHAVAVRNAPAGLEADILAHGLTLDRSVKPRGAGSASVPEKSTAAAVTAAPAVSTAAAASSMVVDTPVRAGQRIYARGCDLIVTAAVNNGAEVIADGSIHIYAPLRGRALAGANGNREARIFTSLMEAELVSIAGMYRTFDEGLPKNLMQQPVQVSLDGDRIDLRTIGFGVRN